MLLYFGVALLILGVASEDSVVKPDKISTGHLIRLQQDSRVQSAVYLYNPTIKPDDDSFKDSNVEQVEGRQDDISRDGRSEAKGTYYIYHPNGLLQKVGYATRDDAVNMAFMARLRYTNVEAVNGPIFTYDPQTYIFRKL